MSTNRREFLKRLGAGAVALVSVRFLSGCETLDFQSKVSGSALDFMTPAVDGSWYWQSGKGISKSDAPNINANNWQLEIANDSGTLGKVTMADLQQYKQDGHEMTMWKTMRCVYGANIGSTTTTLVANGIFTGIPLHRVLEDAGVSAQGISKIRVFGADDFTSNVPIARAMDAGPSPLPALLAYAINGQPISQYRGGPLRLVVPEMWGYKNVKWLTKLQATHSNAIFGTYETERFNPATNPSVTPEIQKRIDDPGRISLASIITDPASVSTQIAGPNVTIAGASFAGGQRVTKVELSINDGPFEPATIIGKQEMLNKLPSSARAAADAAAQTGDPWPWQNIWVTWKKTFANMTPGSYTVTIRATDDAGRVQSADASKPLVISPQVRLPFQVK